MQDRKKRVVTLEDLERAREAEYGHEVDLWVSITQIQGLMRPEKRGGRRLRVSRPKGLSQYGPGKHEVAQIYADRTGGERFDDSK